MPNDTLPVSNEARKSKKPVLIIFAIIIVMTILGIIIVFSLKNDDYVEPIQTETIDIEEKEEVVVLSWQEQYDLGMKYLSEGNYEETIIAFKAVIELDPKNVDAYIALADVYIATNDIDMAIEILEIGFTLTQDEALTAKQESLINSSSTESVETEGSIINNGGTVVSYNNETYFFRSNRNVDNTQSSYALIEFVAMDQTGEQRVLNSSFEVYVGSVAPKLFFDESCCYFNISTNIYYFNLQNDAELIPLELPFEFKTIVAIDETTNKLIIETDYDLITYNTQTQEINTIASSARFITMYQGVILCYNTSFNDDTGSMTIKIINTNGDEFTTIKTDAPYANDNWGGNSYIEKWEIIEDTFYFVYGMRAGSGNYFQGGFLDRINLTTFEYEHLFYTDVEDFYVFYGDDTDVLIAYWADIYSGELGVVYADTLEFIITMSNENVAIFVPDMASDDMRLVAQNPSTNVTYIENIETVDNYIYFTVLGYEHTDDDAYGWRGLYTLKEVHFCKKSIDTGKIETIYSF